MKFGYTIIYVQNVAASVEFYDRVFGLNHRFIDDTSQYAELETGATTLAFAATELAQSNLPDGFTPNTPNQPPAGIEIGLVTEDVPAAFATAVAQGAISVAEPKVKPWGQTVAYVRDLDGVLIELCSPMHPGS
jgi:lactoylglutathione lyase